MTMATHYCTLLEQLLLKGALSKEAIYALCYSRQGDGSGNNNAMQSRILKAAKKQNHIRQLEKTNIVKGRKKKNTYYAITPQGIRYLYQCALEDEKVSTKSRKKTSLPWLSYINIEDTKKAKILTGINEWKGRQFQISEAAVIAELAGAKLNQFIHDPYESVLDISCQELTEENIRKANMKEVASLQGIAKKASLDERPKTKENQTMQELVRGAILRWIVAESQDQEQEKNDYENLVPESTDYIRFLHPRTVKYCSILSSGGDEGNASDASRGRFSGLVQSHFRSVLLYSLHTPNLNWPDSLALAEQATLQRWIMQLKPSFRDGSLMAGSCGAVLVQSPYRFDSLINDAGSMRTTKTPLGNHFRHLFLIEVSKRGADNLRDIMLHTEEEHCEAVLNEFEQDYAGIELHLNTGFHNELFPAYHVENGNTFYLMVGDWIDIKDLPELKRILQTNQTVGCDIICHPWQVDYYKTALGEYGEEVSFWARKKVQNDF